MTSLFSDIQNLLERTYPRVGINLEECLIDGPRYQKLTALAGAQAAELSEIARTFLRHVDGNLRIGIYYSTWLIGQLEKNDPRAGLSEANIRELIVFVEEINHALHAALRFQRGELPQRDESYARNLELQAQVDTYLVLLLFVAFFRKPKPLTRTDRKWLRFHMFGARPPHFSNANLRARYLETTQLAARYTRFLETLNALRRVEEIRVFHALSYPEKTQRILELSARKRAT